MYIFTRNRFLKHLSVMIAVYFFAAMVFCWASGDQLHFTIQKDQSITPKEGAAIMVDGTQVSFPIQPQFDYLDSISLLIGTYGRDNQGTLTMQAFSEDNMLLGESELSTSGLADYIYQEFIFASPLAGVKGKNISIIVSASNVPEGQAVSLWCGTDFSAGKFSVPDMNGNSFAVNGVEMNGKICFTSTGRNELWIGDWYWYFVTALAAMCIGYIINVKRKTDRGQETLVSRVTNMIERYSFLVRQLVGRDFKRKYKRSALGVLWSLLNPLMTMLVQYFVFSTIFRSTIENFIVYLLSGIVLTNYFCESVGLGLTSIIDNAHLINKVYMPKEIYPLSRVLSSLINLLLSLIPLLIVMLITGIPFTKAILLIPIGLICLIFFCLGMSMLLSCSMVFFQDTLFLWNVVSTLWMYLTPTFYPETIIPAVWLPLYRLNPMYQYITFLRVILLDGMAPSPSLYVGCIASAALMFLVGLRVFQKNQNKFVLHL